MKNIDHIIKYLSGEMSADESANFKQEISVKPKLRDEFESISSIWEEIRKQLLLKEETDSEDREQLIAEILAEHDIQLYGTNIESKREIAFKEKLSQSMIEAKKPEKNKRNISPRIYSMITLIAAAMVTALVIILNPAPDVNELTEAYYHPGSDLVFEKISNATRSEMSSALVLFKQGNYKEASSLAFEEMTMYPDITELQLLYALASYESGDFTVAENHLLLLLNEGDKLIAEAANWYLSLVYIQSGNIPKAKFYLEYLESMDNPYQKRASKLLKLMK